MLRRTSLRAGLITGGLTALVVGAGVAVATNAYAAAGCRVAYSAPSQWPGGFTANVAVTNLGDPINGWNLVWTFPSGQRVTQAWNATVTSSGSHGHRHQRGLQRRHRHQRRPCRSASTARGPAATPAPTSFTLNGVTCTGSVGGHHAAAADPPTTAAGRRHARPPDPDRRRRRRPATAMAAVAAMQPGWNLGNSFDATGADETSWGNPRVTAGAARQRQGAGLQEHPDPGDLEPAPGRGAELHHRRGVPEPGQARSSTGRWPTTST